MDLLRVNMRVDLRLPGRAGTRSFGARARF